MAKFIDATLTIKITGRDEHYFIEANGPDGIKVNRHEFTISFSPDQLANLDLLKKKPRNLSLDEITNIGQTMYHAIFHSDIESAFGEIKHLLREDTGARIRLVIEPAELAVLPWEMMHDGQDFIALRSNFPLVRGVSDAQETRKTSVRGPLKILYVWAEPSDLPRLDLQKTAESIQGFLVKNKKIQFDILPHATKEKINSALLKDYHIFCFAGHGTESNLYVESRDTHELISTHALIRMLEGKNTIRLVLLAACKTGEKVNRQEGSFAEILAEKAVPAIVAMQYEIFDEEANRLTARFFETLSSFRPIDVALSEARKTIADERKNIRDVFAPVLFLQTKTSNIFQKAQNWLAIGLAIAFIVAVFIGLFAISRARVEATKRIEVQKTAIIEATKRVEAQAIAILEVTKRAEVQETANAEATKRETAQIEAQRERARALSRQLAAQSNNQLPVDNELALLLAIEAGRKADTFEADTALRNALRTYNQGSKSNLTMKICIGHTDLVNNVAWDPDGKYIVTASSDSTARIWDAMNGDQLFTLSGHKGPVWYVAWDPSGKRIVTTGEDGTARIWEAASGLELAILIPERSSSIAPAPIGNAAWDPNGKRIATASDDGIPRVWDAESGKELFALYGHKSIVSQIAWSPDGNRLATASEDGTARIWSTESGKEVALLKGHHLDGLDSPVRIVAWSPDGTRLLSVGTDNIVVVWDTETWQQKIVLAGPDFFGYPHWPISYAEWDKAGKRVVIANRGFGSYNTAEIWDAETGARLTSLSGHTDWVEYAAWNRDDTQILTSSLDGTVRIWDAQTGEQLRVLTGHTKGISQAKWSSDGRFIASASYDFTSRIWDLEPMSDLPVIVFSRWGGIGNISWDPSGASILIADNEETTIWDIESGKNIVKIPIGTADQFHPSWSPDGKRILIAGFIWDIKSGISTFLTNHNRTLLDSLWNSDGSRIVTAGSDGYVKVWDASDYKMVTEFKAVEPRILRRVAWSPDGNYLVTGDANGQARLWDAVTGDLLTEFNGHGSAILDITLNKDSSRLATSSEDGTARIWDAHSGKQLYLLSGHEGWVNTVSWSPDGSRLVTAGSDHTARIWNVQTGVEIAILLGHTDSIENASWSPDGKRIATASYDNTARIWDASNGSMLSLLMGHGEGRTISTVLQAVWSPTGKYIATIGSDGTVRIHNVFIQDLLEIGCEHAVRNMSEPEWKHYLEGEPYRATCPSLPIKSEHAITPTP